MVAFPREDGRMAQQEIRDPASGSGVMVVEEDVELRSVLNNWLGFKGHRVWLAGSGSEAIDIYGASGAEISLVLIDLDMQPMAGPETLAALRSMNPEVPCIFMCGFPWETAMEGLPAGDAQTFLEKPFCLLKLEELVCRLAAPGLRQTSLQDGRWQDDGGQG